MIKALMVMTLTLANGTERVRVHPEAMKLEECTALKETMPRTLVAEGRGEFTAAKVDCARLSVDDEFSLAKSLPRVTTPK
jgi:hypothetical protein